ncbi:thiamine pyrophosphokinase [Geobacillus genomosp. 3]|uniref:Thiamine diphosphokinase n=1 Tax=Geobacillus genomosp. 3 TaxID=1921421 RepID=S5ZMB0_GEOG3|nr:thiamine diphosphokinase [Geobacillus genomosp. 3]AGT31493.1 thiamine pyrophosphokinase [Geobacillus genomosp. 3]
MVIHIVGGGPRGLLPDLRSYDGKDVRWVGVDRGTAALLEAGLRPVRAFGDFDSLPGEDVARLQQMLPDLDIWPAEKDKTDMEIALDWAVEQTARCIRLFGATGGRLDHLFGNVELLLKYAGRLIEIVDRQNVLTVHLPGTYTVMHDARYRYVSYIPVSEMVTGLTLIGFKYPLTNCHISRGSTLCISNELIQSSGTFSFSEGILMMIRSSDVSCP